MKKSDWTAGRSGKWSATAAKFSIRVKSLAKQACLVGGRPAVKQAVLWHAPRPGGMVLSQLGQVHGMRHKPPAERAFHSSAAVVSQQSKPRLLL